MARVIITDHNYELVVFKNPNVGHKPLRLVPIIGLGMRWHTTPGAMSCPR